ncbi:MAG: cytochrome c [Kiloniellales bacterium]|jgi:mono/diheme cytochrome c family protein|nr:cytochrome c [Kiloniellales bacterium]
MHAGKAASFAACLGLISAFTVLALIFPPSPVRAGDELQQDLVPGLDLWSATRKAKPYPESKDTMADLRPRAERHRKFMEGGVPLEYRGSKNPYPQARMIIDDGGRLYEQHCASCHGAKGSGDGEAGRDLAPPPAFLAYLMKRPQVVDEYLLWTISEGGGPFGSDMPPFAESLTDQQIWQIITYMRADFPDVREVGQD